MITQTHASPRHEVNHSPPHARLHTTGWQCRTDARALEEHSACSDDVSLAATGLSHVVLTGVPRGTQGAEGARPVAWLHPAYANYPVGPIYVHAHSIHETVVSSPLAYPSFQSTSLVAACGSCGQLVAETRAAHLSITSHSSTSKPAVHCTDGASSVFRLAPQSLAPPLKMRPPLAASWASTISSMRHAPQPDVAGAVLLAPRPPPPKPRHAPEPDVTGTVLVAPRPPPPKPLAR